MRGFSDIDYWNFNREEAQRTALLFTLLLSNNNLDRFIGWLKEMGVLPAKFEIVPEEVGVYFEYAYLRDYWQTELTGNGNSNFLKAKFITDRLSNFPDRLKWQEGDCPSTFNKLFISRQNVSKAHIESPSNWNLSKINSTFQGLGSFREACLLKWAFNAKPDLVIHTSRTSVLCIEAKFCSEEGQYPQSAVEKKIFDGKCSGEKKERVRQTEVQKHMLETILGFDFCGLFLSEKIPRTPNQIYSGITWADIWSLVNDSFDLSGFREGQFEIFKTCQT